MAKKKGTLRPGNAGITMLAQLAKLKAREMSPDTARELLQLEFDPDDAARVTVLADKAQTGTLIPEEAAELDEYIRLADIVAVLQSKARQALKLVDVRV